MPKIVDHEVRRRELAEAVWRVIVRDGVGDVSIRSVAAEAGWSSGALRHYFSTRAELLAFLHTYLNDPTDVRSAMIAEPAQREVGGRQRYVVCLRYSAKALDGSYMPMHDRAALYIDGRLDRMIEKPDDVCVGANYAPFPELEKLTR